MTSGDLHKTGLASSCPEPSATTSNACPRDHNISGAHTTDKQCPRSNLDISGRAQTQSDSDTDDLPLSQSLLPQSTPNSTGVSTTLTMVDTIPNTGHFVKPRGRSVTKRDNANSGTGPNRSQSQKPRGSQNSKSRSTGSASTSRSRAGKKDKPPNSRPPSIARGDSDAPNPQHEDPPQPIGQSDKGNSV